MTVAATGPAYTSVNPATGETWATFDHTTDAEIAQALSDSQDAYRRWKDVPILERAEVMRRVAALFVERSTDLASLATKEMGKLLSKGKGEAAFCGDIFTYFADEGPALAADQPIKTFSGGRAVV